MPVGSRQKAEIVKALIHDPQLLLLDEPTGVLDVDEIEALIKTCQAIARSGRAVVLVTHKLGEVARVADAATVLRGGQVAGGGPLSEVPVPRLLDLMVGRQVSDLDPALAATLGVEDPVALGVEDAATVTVAPPTRPRPPVHVSSTDEPVLAVRGVSVRRGNGTFALDSADLLVGPGEIVGIAGVEGNGQSELVSVISGSVPATAGRVEVGGVDVTSASPAKRTELGIGVVPEDRHAEGMVSDLSIAENLFLGRLHEFRRRGLLDRKKLDLAASEQIERYRIRAPGPQAPMRSLSGGNQQKVVLARELGIESLQALVAAQPTRGLDIGAVDNVHGELRAAAARGVGVLVVSSELPELLALCVRVFVSYRGRLLGPVDPSSETALGTIGELMTGTAA
jgi:simple sugar transport system ATP-binding protein